MGAPRVPLALLFGLLASAPLAQGCGRARDCNKLADVANRRAAEIAQLHTRDSKTPDTLATDMKALGGVAERTVEDISTLEIGDELLAEEAREYGKTARDLAEASQSYGALMDALAKHHRTQKDAESSFERSGEGLLNVCASASADCNRVGSVLRNQPRNPEPARLARVLDSYVASLEALDLQEGPVQNAVAMRVAAAKAYKAVVTRRTNLDQDIHNARSRLHEVVDHQNDLIAELNLFCLGRD